MDYRLLHANSTDQEAIDSLNFPESYGIGKTSPNSNRSRTKTFRSLCRNYLVKILRDSDGLFRISSHLVTNEEPLRMVAHNIYGPAFINLNIKGNVEWIKYYKKDNLHRFNEPAFIAYNDNGLIVGEGYYLNGNRHNPVGPAERNFSDLKWDNKFYIRNHRLTLDSFFKRKRWQNDSLRDE